MSDVHTFRRVGRLGRHPSPFWRHFWQMLAVMAAGMVGSAAIFLTIVGMSWEEATARRPTASLLVIAAGMGVPTTAWMSHLYRRGEYSMDMARP